MPLADGWGNNMLTKIEGANNLVITGDVRIAQDGITGKVVVDVEDAGGKVYSAQLGDVEALKKDVGKDLAKRVDAALALL